MVKREDGPVWKTYNSEFFLNGHPTFNNWISKYKTFYVFCFHLIGGIRIFLICNSKQFYKQLP